MTVLPRSAVWKRLDTSGAEQVSFDDGHGLVARGVTVAAEPLPYSGRYQLYTDDAWASVRFEATVEGAGWLRTVRLERAAGRWRVTTAEQGDLDAALRGVGRLVSHFPGIEDPDRLYGALDIDVSTSPLTNTLPIRRLGLYDAAAGTERTVLVAQVLLPSLAVVPSEQTYTAVGPGQVRFAVGGFTVDLHLDANGYVVRYPGLAER